MWGGVVCLFVCFLFRACAPALLLSLSLSLSVSLSLSLCVSLSLSLSLSLLPRRRQNALPQKLTQKNPLLPPANLVALNITPLGELSLARRPKAQQPRLNKVNVSCCSGFCLLFSFLLCVCGALSPLTPLAVVASRPAIYWPPPWRAAATTPTVFIASACCSLIPSSSAALSSWK